MIKESRVFLEYVRSTEEVKNRFARAVNEVFSITFFKVNHIQNIIINKITETGKLTWS